MTNDPMAQARAALKEHWGYDDFRPAQAAVIEAVLNGDDVLAVLATGYGKSVCFQIPAIVRDGCALVVSPLIALMKDQVDAANANGIPASYINSHVDPDEAMERLADLKAGAFKLFYVAPERMRSRAFRGYLSDSPINLIAIDEAHCASMWGHDFRPAYSRLHEIADLLWNGDSRPPILAVTATATHEIEGDIATSLGMNEEYVRIVGDPVRPNLHYHVEHPYGSEWGALLSHAKQKFFQAGRHLVYCGTRGACEKVAEILAETFPSNIIGFYHGGMEKKDRVAVQEAFVAGQKRIVCATNAFGMGIDVPDIRTVLHFGVPGSVESYVQETGRAGRDGKDSDVVLVTTQFAKDLQHQFIDNNNPPMSLYRAVWGWLSKTLEDGEILRLSASDIADRAAASSGKMVKAAQASTILNVLEAHGLIEREYYEGGTPITVDVKDSLARIGSMDPKLAKTKVLMCVVKAAQKRQHEHLPDRVLLDIEKGDIAFDARVTEGTVTKALRELDADMILDVGRVFTGKTTKIRTRGEIDDLLPMQRLQAKRDRDLARFGAMLDYTKAANPKQFIRDYFKGRLDTESRRKEASE